MTDYDISIFSNKNNGKFTPLGSGLNDIIADLKKNKVGVVFIPDETAMTGVSRSAEAAVNDAISQLKPKTFFLDQQDGADNRAKVENIKAGARGSELAASSLVGPSKMGVAQDQMLTRFDILKQTDIKLARPDGGINPDFRKEMQDAKKAVVAEEKDAKEDFKRVFNTYAHISFVPSDKKGEPPIRKTPDKIYHDDAVAISDMIKSGKIDAKSIFKEGSVDEIKSANKDQIAALSGVLEGKMNSLVAPYRTSIDAAIASSSEAEKHADFSNKPTKELTFPELNRFGVLSYQTMPAYGQRDIAVDKVTEITSKYIAQDISNAASKGVVVARLNHDLTIAPDGDVNDKVKNSATVSIVPVSKGDLEKIKEGTGTTTFKSNYNDSDYVMFVEEQKMRSQLGGVSPVDLKTDGKPLQK